MAEVVGVVASGAGLASLAIQLLDGVNRLHTLYKDSRIVEQTVDDLVLDLKNIYKLLSDLGH
jgi:hypothetical protein